MAAPTTERGPRQLDGPARRLARPARAAYRFLAMRGLTAAEAGNLAALTNGLDPVDGGWTVREIERLLFLRYLVATGRIAG